MFNFSFAGNNTTGAVLNEMQTYFVYIPKLAAMINELQNELDSYLRLSNDAIGIRLTIDNVVIKATLTVLWSFWKDRCLQLPNFFKAAKLIAIIMTSSASVERMFSLYVSMFNSEQERVLEDRREASVLMRYNDNQRNHH